MKLNDFVFSPVNYFSGHSAWMEHAPFAFYLIEQLKPRIFAELGSYYGDSYCAFCQAIKSLGLPARAYAVDTFLGDGHAGKLSQDAYNLLKQYNDLHYSHFSNLLCTTFDEACPLFEDKSIDLLHIDGLHTYEAVKHDYETWLPKMSDRGVMVFHDTAITVGDFGVWKLMDELKNLFPYFSFVHGYGLGILCTGKEVPKDFLAFIETANKEPLISTLFQLAGQKITLENQVDILKQSLTDLQERPEQDSYNHNKQELDVPCVNTETGSLSEQVLVQQELSSSLTSTTTPVLRFPRFFNRLQKLAVSKLGKLKSNNISARGISLFKGKSVSPEIKKIQESGLFDPDYYLAENPDVRTSGLDPSMHYYYNGGFEGRRPYPGFDSAYYLNEYPDVKTAGINPLLHYILFGKQEGRKTSSEIQQQPQAELPETDYVSLIRQSRLFSKEYYLSNNPDLQQAGVDPVRHFLDFGWKEGRSPSWEFNTNYYLSTYPDIRESGINPLVHYLLHGEPEGRKTNPLDDPENIMERPPRVLIISNEFLTPGHYYRVLNLLESYRELGIHAIWRPPEQAVNEFDTYSQLALIVLWRTAYTFEIQTIAKWAREHGCLLIFDMDDLLFDPYLAEPRQMDAIRSLHHGTVDLKIYCSRMQTTAWLADVCTASTKEIGDAFEKMGKKSFIIPNGYSRENFEKSISLTHPVEREAGIIRIGYAGGTLTHQRDFSVAAPALVRILREFPQTCLTVFSGVLQIDEFPELTDFADRIESRDLVPYDELHKEINRFDINIAPLEINSFCNAKSELKFFEAALLAIPTIASPTPPFRRCIIHGHNGFLADSSEDWHQCLQKLVSDPTLRKSTGENARTYVRWRFSPDERNLVVRSILTTLTKDFNLSNELTTNNSHFAFPEADPPFRYDVPDIHFPFAEQQHTLYEKKSGKLSEVGILVTNNSESDDIFNTLDSLTRQTVDSFDLILLTEHYNEVFRETLDNWLTINSNKVNHFILAENQPGSTPHGFLNFALESLITDHFMVVRAGIYLLPDTILNFCKTMKDTLAEAVTGNLAGCNEVITLVRSGYAISIGGFSAAALTVADASEQMVKCFKDKGLTVVTLLSTASFSAPVQRGDYPHPGGSVNEQQTILFIGHDDARAGAQVVLLNILKWMHNEKKFRLILLLIECRDKLKADYEKVAEVICFDELRRTFRDPLTRRAILSDRLGDIDLIYGNTVLSASMRDELGFLHVPFIIHIHELENVLLILLTTQTLYGFQHWPDQYISCTPSVAKILSETYQVDPGKISTIGEFISPPVSGTIPTKAAARERLHMDPGTFIVMSFGAINYRKGSDLFIQTATVLKKMGFTSFHFYWFGENQWDIEAPLWNSPSWESCLQELAACGLTDQVTFMGPTDNIYDYLPAADLFYLPSREDPLPLVALEASLAGVTTLCFENSGGIPLAFGPDNVLTVEKENISDAARKIIEIALNPEFFTTYGRRASQLVRENFISDTVVPKIYSLCRETMKNKASGSGQANAAGGSDRSFRWTFITTNDGSFDGGSEKLWVQSAIRCQQNGDDVSIVIKKWDPLPSFIQTFVQSGIAVIFKSDDPYRALLDFHPDLVVISIGDQDEGVEWYDFCRVYKYPFVIVNQLTKEPSVWPVNKTLIPGLTRGHMAATRVLFTGQNNLRLMERRLGVPIPQAGIFFNPVDTDRDQAIPYPDSSNGLQIAIIGSLLDIHKGQSLAIRLMNLPKWKNRPLTLHLYGQGPDEAQFRSMAEKFQLNNVVFHGHVTDIPAIWKVNHLLLMSSLMEGLPLVLVSAMMAGRAAVVTDIGAHAEVIDDDRTGFLASEPTVEALDQALERAWIRRHEWHQMGLDARAFIRQYIPEDPVGHFIGMVRGFVKLSGVNEQV